MPILGQPVLNAQILRPKTGNSAGLDKRSAFDPTFSVQDNNPNAAPETQQQRFQAGSTQPGIQNPYLPSAQRGTPARDNFANQGPWHRLAAEGRDYRANQPTPTGQNFGQGIAANAGTFEGPQTERAQPMTPVMDRELPMRPMQGGATPMGPGGQTPFVPAEQTPSFRGAQPLRFLGNPLRMTRTDQSLTDTMAGTRQPGRLPVGILPARTRVPVGGRPPMPSPMPVPRFRQPRIQKQS